jgi:hypothetical protein
MSKTAWDLTQSIIALILILFAISGTLLDQVSRVGFFVSLAFLLLIAVAALIKEKRVKA